MKLADLEIENFRALERVVFQPSEKINVVVGPNAMGKTTILEAIRLCKSILAPRYGDEGTQVLVGIGALSQHHNIFGINSVDYSSLARDPVKPLHIKLVYKLSVSEYQKLESLFSQLCLSLVQAEAGIRDNQAFTQYVSSDGGRNRLKDAEGKMRTFLDSIKHDPSLMLDLTIDPTSGSFAGKSLADQIAFMTLERSLSPISALQSYFPADRAFPSGEVAIQIGSADAAAQLQSHMGQPATKYQRLKNLVVHNVITNRLKNNEIEASFKKIFDSLLPGKSLASISLTPINQVKIIIKDQNTGKFFDIDSMSSGEKGLILSFLLISTTMEEGGIVLIDEPELHLNPAVCKKILPFLFENFSKNNALQFLICTHSPEILGTAFDKSECALFHLRSERDLSPVLRTDRMEMFEAFKRLGASPADVLFWRGNVFVEGEHDAEILSEGFDELLSGYRVAQLGGRNEVEKEIIALQKAEAEGKLEKLQIFIFDFDKRPTRLTSTALVKVIQWDRWCLENYLLDLNLLFDAVSECATNKPSSRGSFAEKLRELAFEQIAPLVGGNIYQEMEPTNPGLRPKELVGKSFAETAAHLDGRFTKIVADIEKLRNDNWQIEFCRKCTEAENATKEDWKNDWQRKADGKRLIDSMYKEFQINRDKLQFKKDIMISMKIKGAENWKLIESSMRAALTV